VARTALLSASLGVSALLHALALAILLALPRLPDPQALAVFPVSLVGDPGGGGGGDRAPTAGAPSDTAPAPRPEVAKAAQPTARRAAPAPTSARPAAPEATASSGGLQGEGHASGVAAGGGDGGGAGDGAGDGAGSAGNGVGYATNPLPPYPLLARRLGKEGIVVLDVLVTPDGRAADVRVVQSSGFAPLDESAARTVRERWRFVPARRGATAVESRATVPIRFRLDDGRG
jgi:protein TonB